MKSIINLRSRDWTIPVFLGLVAALSFGLFIPWLGYYWDDWAKILVDRLYGLSGYWAYYSYDRPLSAWTHIVFTPLLGDAPWVWQLFSLILRWLTAWAMYWALTAMWPQAKRQALFMSLLFLVYPAFSQQSIALTFHQMWLQYLFYFLSLGAMLWAIRKPRRAVLWTCIAIVCMMLQLSVTEYFVGIEFLRPLLILILVSQSDSSWKHRLRNTLRYSLPYLAVMLIYLIWRFFLMKLAEPDPYKLEILSGLIKTPLQTLVALAKMMFVDLRFALITAWTHLFDTPLEVLLQPAVVACIGASVVGGIITLIYLLRRDKGENANMESQVWYRQAIPIGVVALLLGGAPAWLTGRLITLDFHSNRHAMAMMLGASLLFIGLMDWLIQRRVQSSLVLSLFVSMAIMLNLGSANDFRHEWQDQLSFYWQLYWRAPFIQPGTALIMEQDPFPDDTLFSTSSAINYLYPQPKDPPQLGYYLYAMRPRWSLLTQAPAVIEFNTHFRSFYFKASTPDSLLFDYDPNETHCLWMVYPDTAINPYLPDIAAIFSQVSNPSRIQDVPPRTSYPAVDVFGKEPEHTWCYYFEKADLARQTGDWQAVAVLYEQASQSGYNPGVHPVILPYEWTPFIEGIAKAGKLQEAVDLTIEAYQSETGSKEMFCSLWKRINASAPSPQMAETSQAVFAKLACQP